MTVTATSVTIDAPMTVASSQRRSGYIAFVFWAALYILPCMCFLLPGSDEGTLLYGAVRVARGEVFARDFFEVIGPGTFYWLAAFFKLFGVSFLATRICLFLTSLGTALLMYFLSRRLCARYQSLPILLLAATYFGVVWPGISHHVDSNFFALLAVACIVLWHDGRRNRLLLAAGALAGLTTALFQPKGLLLFCAFVVWLLIRHRYHTPAISSLAIITGGYLSVIGLVLLYFWSKGALGSLVADNFVWPSRHYGSVNSVPYASSILSSYWDHWVVDKNSFPLSIPLAAILMVPFLFVAALPGLLAGLGVRYKWSLSSPEVLLYWLCGGALWLAELHRMDIVHLVFGSPLLIILCIHFLGRYGGKIADLALQMLSVSAVCLLAFNLLCLLLSAHTVKTRVGSIEMLRSDPMLAFLEEHVAPGEEIFAYPHSPEYYFLSSTTNPTRYSILMYDYNTPSQFQEVVRILEQHKVRCVIWDTNFVRNTDRKSVV